MNHDQNHNLAEFEVLRMEAAHTGSTDQQVDQGCPLVNRTPTEPHGAQGQKVSGTASLRAPPDVALPDVQGDVRDQGHQHDGGALTISSSSRSTRTSSSAPTRSGDGIEQQELQPDGTITYERNRPLPKSSG